MYAGFLPERNALAASLAVPFTVSLTVSLTVSGRHLRGASAFAILAKKFRNPDIDRNGG
jgi:hypothetical protein